jgi:hypothetical protein
MRSGDGVRLLMQTLMMNNMQRQDKKDAQFMANAFNPVDYKTQQTDTNFQFKDTTGQAVRDKANQGLLSSGILGNMDTPTSVDVGQGLLGSKPPTNNYQFTNPMDQYSKSRPENQMTTTTTTKDLGIGDIQSQIKKSWADKVKADIKGMSGEGARQYMSMARQTLQDQLGQVKTDYQEKQRIGWLETLGGDGDYKSKMIAGIRAGVDPQLMKMALDSGVKIDIRRLGDRDTPFAIDERNQRIINMFTGKPVTQEDLQYGMTPYQQYRTDGGTVGNPSGGAVNNGNGTVNKPQSTYFTNYETRGNMQKDQSLMDEYNARIANGEEIKPSEQHVYNGAAARLNAYLKQRDNGEQPQASEQPQVDIRSAVLTAKKYNYPDEQIAEKLGISVEEVRAMTGGSAPAQSGGGFKLSEIPVPTVGSNNETVLDYLKNGTWLKDTQKYIGGKYGG